MASNAEMRRLILHAADRLAEEDATLAHVAVIRELIDDDARIRWTRRCASQASTMTLAEQTLRMVAACLAEDETEVDRG